MIVQSPEFPEVSGSHPQFHQLCDLRRKINADLEMFNRLYVLSKEDKAWIMERRMKKPITLSELWHLEHRK